MNLKNLNLLSLQTSYMKQDKTTQGLCAALEPILKQIADEVKNCIIYARIDELAESIIDELAWQMHLDFYDSNLPIETKKILVKNSFKWHKYKGTPSAVEGLITDVFGDAKLKEWFEYGGQPYHFKVIVRDREILQSKEQQFLRALGSVKNARSVLEAIELDFTTWNTRDSYNYTWSQWDTLGLNWDEWELYLE